MKVSIITICYNAVDHIDETIRSVVMQEHRDIEHIVIDGGSTDGTRTKIERYREVIALYVSEPDKGVYDAMNKGLRAATGDVIAFVNAGDMIAHRSCVSEMVNAFATSDAEAIYGDAYMVDSARHQKGCAVLEGRRIQTRSFPQRLDASAFGHLHPQKCL